MNAIIVYGVFQTLTGIGWIINKASENKKVKTAGFIIGVSGALVLTILILIAWIKSF